MNSIETTIVSEHTVYIRTLTINTDHTLANPGGKRFNPKVITVTGTEGKPTFRVNVSGYLFKLDGTPGRRTEADFIHPGKATGTYNLPVPAWILELIGTPTTKA
jgi:hypothetical protein